MSTHKEEIERLRAAADEGIKGIKEYLAEGVPGGDHEAFMLTYTPMLKRIINDIETNTDLAIGLINVVQIFKQFPTQEICIKYLEKARWDYKTKCVYCGSLNINPQVKTLRYFCNSCSASFSVIQGTVFHGTHIPLQKWFLLIGLMQSANKITHRQAARALGISTASAFSIMHRIKKGISDNDSLLKSILDII